MSIPDETARAWVDVDLPALIANARTVAAISGAGLLPMVKGNAYGLGALACARALEALDPWGFGVATALEGAALRSAGIRRPILVFSPFTPESLPHFQSHQLRPAICDHQGLDAWLAHGDAPFHVEVDTGMSRTGFRWNDTSDWRESSPLRQRMRRNFHPLSFRRAGYRFVTASVAAVARCGERVFRSAPRWFMRPTAPPPCEAAPTRATWSVPGFSSMAGVPTALSPLPWPACAPESWPPAWSGPGRA